MQGLTLSLAPSSGVHGDQDQGGLQGLSVPFSLLITCVLLAFLLGSILSGSVVSCYCRKGSSQGAELALGKEPQMPLPHSMSLGSLAKLSGLLDQPQVSRNLKSALLLKKSAAASNLAPFSCER